MRAGSGLRAGLVAALAVPLLAGCSVFGGDDDGNVFSVQPGQCFLAPEKVKAQVSSLDRVDCKEKHDQEAFAVLAYTGTGAEEGTFPGDDALIDWADGSCAKAFGGYVGVDYLDSELFYTYLLPSARSWQDKDRDVICFVIDSGRPMSGSVKGSKK